MSQDNERLILQGFRAKSAAALLYRRIECLSNRYSNVATMLAVCGCGALPQTRSSNALAADTRAAMYWRQ
jgi:hypothetical protein